jgi:hypothetical protein
VKYSYNRITLLWQRCRICFMVLGGMDAPGNFRGSASAKFGNRPLLTARWESLPSCRLRKDIQQMNVGPAHNFALLSDNRTEMTQFNRVGSILITEDAEPSKRGCHLPPLPRSSVAQAWFVNECRTFLAASTINTNRPSLCTA